MMNIIPGLTQIPNISYQYNLDTFLLQFQTNIRAREQSDHATFKSCIIALLAAYIFYAGVNWAATQLANHHLKQDWVDTITVYESLLLLSEAAISTLLSLLFMAVALINIVFSSLIAYEQATMFYQEWRHKEESMRVERYLAIKNRPLSDFIDESQVKVELTYPRQVTRRNKFVIMLILLGINTILCIIPVQTT